MNTANTARKKKSRPSVAVPFIVLAAGMLVLQLLNSLVIKPYYVGSFTDNLWFRFIYYFIAFVSLTISVAGAALVVYSTFRGRVRDGISAIAVALLMQLLGSLISFLSDLPKLTEPEYIYAVAMSLLLNFGIIALEFILIFVVCLIIHKKTPGISTGINRIVSFKNPILLSTFISVIILFVIRVVSEVADTVSFLVEYNITKEEIMSIAGVHISLVIGMVYAYFAIMSLILLFDHINGKTAETPV